MVRPRHISAFLLWDSHLLGDSSGAWAQSHWMDSCHFLGFFQSGETHKLFHDSLRRPLMGLNDLDSLIRLLSVLVRLSFMIYCRLQVHCWLMSGTGEDSRKLSLPRGMPLSRAFYDYLLHSLIFGLVIGFSPYNVDLSNLWQLSMWSFMMFQHQRMWGVRRTRSNTVSCLLDHRINQSKNTSWYHWLLGRMFYDWRFLPTRLWSIHFDFIWWLYRVKQKLLYCAVLVYWK